MCARRNFVGTHGNFFALASDHSSTLVMNKQSGPHREILPLKPFRAFRAPGFPPNCKRLRGDIHHSFFGNWFAVLLLSANPRLSFFQTSTCPTPCLNLSARAPFRPLTGPSLFREEPRRPRIHHRGCTCGREISPLSSPTASIADAARAAPRAHIFPLAARSPDYRRRAPITAGASLPGVAPGTARAAPLPCAAPRHRFPVPTMPEPLRPRGRPRHGACRVGQPHNGTVPATEADGASANTKDRADSCVAVRP